MMFGVTTMVLEHGIRPHIGYFGYRKRTLDCFLTLTFTDLLSFALSFTDSSFFSQPRVTSLTYLLKSTGVQRNPRGSWYSHSVKSVAQGHSSTDTKTPCQVHLHIGVNLLAQRALGLL